MGSNLRSPPHLSSMEKLSSTKLVPGAKNVGDHCLRSLTNPLMGLEIPQRNALELPSLIWNTKRLFTVHPLPSQARISWGGRKNTKNRQLRHRVMSTLYHQWPTCKSHGFAAQRELCRQPLVRLKSSILVRGSLHIRGTWSFRRLNC